ncbi:subtilisin-like protein [Laetiporus sulphureus 93-53]|uniref:Subtilisin-like protein n=1 Tax=Laetiporus sulphureus 93-53 TaxID=1314785 RepID=A0A165D248_9APHY|nr:subtilisin-like protein [Laetiporus sulphureus 93-53]KZT04003.1 subtilisin-like protein [Laetiporus sulphureus 93-53]
MPLAVRLLAALSLGLSIAGAPSASSLSVVHESRNNVPAGWAPVRRAEPDMILPFRIGLAQPNLENLEAFIMDVSHPESPNYGKHWSSTKVAETFRPSKETVDTVRAWLIENGLEDDRVKLSFGGGWLKANVTIAEAERLLGTEYYVYQFGDDEDYTYIACHEKYHLPEHVSEHVELVTPTLHFDVKPRRSPAKLEKFEKRAATSYNSSAHSVGQPGFGVSFPKTSGTIQSIISELEDYDEQIVPDCLRALYDFAYVHVSDGNSIAIVEYTPQAYVPTDLDMFFEQFSPSQVGERPVLDSIDGGYVQSEYTGFSYNGESNLDLQYAMALVGGSQPVTLYQARDIVEGASFNNLLDALDASYCTYDGGDDPEYDAIYPDPYGGGYEAHVMSTSYAYNEADLTPAYEQRQCAEYAKLGLIGMTILYSSGDYGVAGNGGLCLYPNGTQAVGAPDFNPSFPGTCPYITSVGATQANPNSTVFEPESACEQVIYSGGGFSNKTAVETYLAEYPPPYPPTMYNSSGTSRAFPDISANGANYVVAIQGEFYLVYGTSCSSPVSASIFSAINDARLAVGKGPIGFINPTIYTAEFMAAFHDITTGTNPGCGTAGFSAEPGWDPVTGVGTPNFSKLVALWLALP